MKFWLGMHRVECMPRTEVPLFVSAVRLRRRKRLPRAAGPWALDSGGFSEIAKHGTWTIPAKQYVAEVRRWRDEIGNLQWVAIQDWMCEPFMLAKTGYSVEQHQQLTVNSWVVLNSLDGSIPWVPVIQGYTLDDYHRCVDLYESHTATRLKELPLVGLGSVCRRQGMDEAASIIKSLWRRGLRNLHGFGFKTLGLTSSHRLACYLKSADSMAWSDRARRAWRHDGVRLCGTQHKGGCANCLTFALRWREKLVARIDRIASGGTPGFLF